MRKSRYLICENIKGSFNNYRLKDFRKMVIVCFFNYNLERK